MRLDLGTIVAVLMLVVWAIGALVYDGPGWIHLLLTGGVAMLIWRAVERPAPPTKR
jgi:threonine/homoserine/homoserine lactone efflux protein